MRRSIDAALARAPGRVRAWVNETAVVSRVEFCEGRAGALDLVLNAIFGAMLAMVILEEIVARYLSATTQHWYPSPHFALFTGEWFLFAAIYATFFIHVVTADTPRERWVLVACFPISLVAIWLVAGRLFNNTAALIGCAGAGASLLTHAVFYLRHHASRAPRLVQLRAVWILVLAMSTILFLMEVSRTFRPLLDNNIFLFEERLGIRISAALNLLSSNVPVLKTLLYLVYCTMPAAIALLLHFEKAKRVRLLVMIAMFGPVAFTLYYCFPAVGPNYAFLGYQDQVWTGLLAEPALPAQNPLWDWAPTNCMPSEHAVLALLLLFNLDETPEPIRSAIRAFGILSLIAIFPIGGHWFTDLVVAVPLAVAEQALISVGGRPWKGARLEAFVFCGLLVAAWFWALRTEWFIVESPGVLRWAAIAITLAVSIALVLPLVGRRRAVAAGALQPAE
jgi:hypothetical protein